MPSLPPASFQGLREALSHPLHLTDVLLKKQTLHAFSALRLGDYSGPFIFVKWELQGEKRRKSQQIARSTQAAKRRLEAPPDGRATARWPRARSRQQAPSAVGMKTSQTALCDFAGDLGRPVSCNTHTPTGLRAVRLVPKANTELIFPAYSFHVWAAAGFTGSLGSLLLTLPKPPAPSAWLAPGSSLLYTQVLTQCSVSLRSEKSPRDWPLKSGSW